MLPLVSTTMPRLTGVRSALKCVTSTRLVVLVDQEVFLAQTAVEASRSVGDGRRDVDQLDAALELEPPCSCSRAKLAGGERKNDRSERRRCSGDGGA